jgi:hypothetical protein
MTSRNEVRLFVVRTAIRGTQDVIVQATSGTEARQLVRRLVAGDIDALPEGSGPDVVGVVDFGDAQERITGVYEARVLAREDYDPCEPTAREEAEVAHVDDLDAEARGEV